jgi:ankyrin repeat protein
VCASTQILVPTLTSLSIPSILQPTTTTTTTTFDTMSPPEIPFDILLMIARCLTDDDGELCFADFNSFLKVNSSLYACLSRTLWKEAAGSDFATERVFTQLIRTNDLTRLKVFLELGANVEVSLPAFELKGSGVDEYEKVMQPTLLLIAADLDDVPLARLLIKHGAGVEYVDQGTDGNGDGTGDDDGVFSPLHAARSAEMVQLLLDHGADPDLEDEIGRRPLQWYAIRGESAPMRAILQHGAQLNLCRHWEMPLHEAARRNLEAVKLLVEYGADVEETEEDLKTPLHAASEAGKLDVVKFLVELSPEGIRKRDDCLATPLHRAAGAGKTEVVKVLVERWPDGMKKRDFWLNTPLHMAAASRLENTDLVRFLVERWPEGKEALNDQGQTPLSVFEEDQTAVGLAHRQEIFALLDDMP